MWNDERGFGFITSGSGDARVFVQVSAFRGVGDLPPAARSRMWRLGIGVSAVTQLTSSMRGG